MWEGWRAGRVRPAGPSPGLVTVLFWFLTPTFRDTHLPSNQDIQETRPPRDAASGLRPSSLEGGVSGTGQFSWSPQFTLGGGCHPSLEARSPLSTQPAGPSLSCPWFSLLGSMGYRTPGLWRCSKKAMGTGWDPCSPHVFRQRPCGPKQCDPELSPAHSGVVRPVQDGLGAITRLR